MINATDLDLKLTKILNNTRLMMYKNQYKGIVLYDYDGDIYSYISACLSYNLAAAGSYELIICKKKGKELKALKYFYPKVKFISKKQFNKQDNKNFLLCVKNSKFETIQIYNNYKSLIKDLSNEEIAYLCKNYYNYKRKTKKYSSFINKYKEILND